jgi:hypothetical protein
VLSDSHFFGRFIGLIYREASELENALLLAMPLFPVDIVNDLHDIRQVLIDYRASLQDILGVIAGENGETVITRAKMSALDSKGFKIKLRSLQNHRWPGNIGDGAKRFKIIGGYNNPRSENHF